MRLFHRERAQGEKREREREKKDFSNYAQHPNVRALFLFTTDRKGTAEKNSLFVGALSKEGETRRILGFSFNPLTRRMFRGD